MSEPTEAARLKSCSRCDRALPRTAFNVRKLSGDGLQPCCRDCSRAKDAERRRHHGAELNARKRARRLASIEEERARQRAYYAANRDRIAAKQLGYRQRTRAQASARTAAWYAANRERAQEYKRAYRLANLEHKNAAERAWKLENRELVYAANARREALKRGAATSERIYRRTVWERDGGVCRLCGLPADASKWHLEHLTPLSRGGSHIYGNVAVSHPACNLAKFRMTFEEWTASRSAA